MHFQNSVKWVNFGYMHSSVISYYAFDKRGKPARDKLNSMSLP